MLKSLPLKAIQLIVFAAVVFFFLWLLKTNIHGLDVRQIHWWPGAIVLALLFLQAGMLVNVVFTFYVFRFLGAPVNFTNAYHCYFISALGRHIPGRVWQILAMTYMAKRYGINVFRSTSLFLINQILIVIGGFLFVLVTGYLLSDMNAAFRVASMLPLLPLVIILAMPNLLVRIINSCLKIVRMPPIDCHVSYRYLFLTIVFVFATFMLSGTGFYFLARGIGLQIDDYFFLVAVYPFSYLMGYLAFFVPGGFGVRESFIILLLKSHYPGDQSALLALAAIGWWYMVEFLNCMVALMTMKDPLFLRLRNSSCDEGD